MSEFYCVDNKISNQVKSETNKDARARRLELFCCLVAQVLTGAHLGYAKGLFHFFNYIIIFLIY